MSRNFEGRGLGKREPLPEKRALLLKDVLTGVVPDVPSDVDWLSAVPSWESGRNFEFGTCGPTSVANFYRLVYWRMFGTFPPITTEDVFDLYRRSGNPNFDPTKSWDDPTQEDNGVYMHVMLDALLAGGIAGLKPLAFAKIEAGDFDTLHKADAIFGGTVLGLMLRTPQQRQEVWDAVGGGLWGGHAVLSGRSRDPEGTTADRNGIVTWTEVLETTREFIEQQEDEAWVVILPEHLNNDAFLEGVDVDRLASAYESLTGRPFPSYVPPSEPVPAPPSDPVADDLDTALRKFITKKSCPAYVRVAAEDWLDMRDA